MKWKNLTNRVLATPCLLCLTAPARQRGFCQDCEDELPWQPPGCHTCGVALTDTVTTQPSPAWSSGDSDATVHLCFRCRQTQPAFSRCLCTFAYEAPVSSMIRRFKDRGGFPEFRALSNCFIAHFLQHYRDSETVWPDILLPVPLHPSRLRARGFNQALLLARRLSRHTGIPVLAHSCQRRSGTAQRGLDAQARLHNMQGVFSIRTGTALTPGMRLAIIDDVVTTSATTQAMAAVMHSTAAARIDVWALARSNHQPES